MGAGENTKRVISLLLISLFMLSFPVDGRDEPVSHYIEEELPYVFSSPSRSIFLDNLTSRGPIIIDGDDAFNETNGVVSGNGTENDPYIISGWSINSTYQTSGDDRTIISISNTTKDVMIRSNGVLPSTGTDIVRIYMVNISNCSVINNSFISASYLISRSNHLTISNSSGGMDADLDIVSSNNITIQRIGIYACHIENATNLIIMNCTLDGSSPPFYIEWSENVEIKGNEMTDYYIDFNSGVYINRSLNISFTENRFTNCDVLPLRLNYCIKFTFSNNNIKKAWILFIVTNSNNLNFIRNDATPNFFDINSVDFIIESSFNITISDWKILNWEFNLRIRIDLKYVSNCLITDNALYSGYPAIRIESSSIINFNNNIVTSYNSIFITDSYGIRIVSNDILYGNQYEILYSIILEGCQDVDLIHNRFDINGTSKKFDAIRMSDSKDVTIGMNVFLNVSSGVRYSDSTDITIQENVFFDFYSGIIIHSSSSESDRVWIENNSFHNGIRGIKFFQYFGVCKLVNNSFDCSDSSIVLSSYPSLSLKDNAFIGSFLNITDDHDLVYESLELLDGNTLNGRPIVYFKSQGYVRLPAYDLGMAILWNCTDSNLFQFTIINSSFGLSIYSSNNISISKFRISNSTMGIHLHGCDNISIESQHLANEVNDCEFGIDVSYSNEIKIGNTIFQRCNTSIHMHYSIWAFVESNHFFLNNLEIDIHSSRNVRIYDNHGLHSDKQVVYDSFSVMWFISPVSGRNILNGPKIAGNYWLDYEGHDYDGDGFGDTNIPYGPGDEYPLMPDRIDPYFENHGDGMAFTGDPFFINWSVTDNFGVESVFIDYRIGNKDLIRMVLDEGEHDAYWGYVQIPLNSTDTLIYRLTAIDISGNERETQFLYYDIVDNKPPEMESLLFRSVVNVGEDIVIGADFSDNIGIGEVMIDIINTEGRNEDWKLITYGEEYWYNGNPQYTAGTYQFRLVCLDHHRELRESNAFVSKWFNITVLDTAPPIIRFYSPSEGSYWNKDFYLNFSVEDDECEISNITIFYHNFSHTMEKESRMHWIFNSYFVDISGLPDGHMEFIIEAKNSQGLSSWGNVTVIIDKTAPTANAGNGLILDPGDGLDLDGSGSYDEYGISDYYWFYRSGTDLSKTYIGDKVEMNNIALPGPGRFTVTLIVTDRAGNMGEDSFEVMVKEYSNYPVLTSSTLDATPYPVRIDINVVSFYFDAPMDLKSFEGKVMIDPLPLYRLKISTSGHRLDIEFIAPLMYGTNYSIQIIGGLGTNGAKLGNCPYVYFIETEGRPDDMVDKTDESGSILLPVVITLLVVMGLAGIVLYIYSRSKNNDYEE